MTVLLDRHIKIVHFVDSPLDLFDAPRNLFVASFIDAPKMNMPTGPEAARHNAHTIGIRPEHLAISTSGGDWTGTIAISEHLGSDTFIRVDVRGVQDTMTVRAPGKVRLAMGDRVYLTPVMENPHKFDKTGLKISQAAHHEGITKRLLRPRARHSGWEDS